MSAQRYQPDRIGFFTALLGLVIAPGETVRQLLSGDRPRYAFSLLVILFLAVFVPIFIQWHYYGRNLYQPEALALLFLMLLLTLLIFVVIEFLLLMLMGVRCSIRDLMGIVCYCLSPIILGILAMYAINYAASGSLTFVTFVLNGTAAEEDKFIELVPWVLSAAGLAVLYIYYNGLKAAGDILSVNAIMITVVSVIPLYLAILGAAVITEKVNPGTIELLQQIIYAPQAILGGAS